MNTRIEYSDRLTKPNENYNYSFKVDIELQLDLPDTLLTDEEYKKVTNAIKTIRRTFAPYREKAEQKLRIAAIREKAKKEATV